MVNMKDAVYDDREEPEDKEAKLQGEIVIYQTFQMVTSSVHRHRKV